MGSEFESQQEKEFLRLHIAKTICEAHPASYQMDTGGSFCGNKLQGCEVDPSPPTSVEVKKMWTYTSTPPLIFIAQ
jgi:hypothetical protein